MSQQLNIRQWGDEWYVSMRSPGMVFVKVYKARQLQLLQLLCLAPGRLGLLHSQQVLMCESYKSSRAPRGKEL